MILIHYRLARKACRSSRSMATTLLSSLKILCLYTPIALKVCPKRFSLSGSITHKDKVVTLGIGQRTDVLVTAPANAKGKSYTMRSSLAGNGCSVTNQPDATAVVYYNTMRTPNTTAWPAFIDSVAHQCANVSYLSLNPTLPIH